MQVVLFVNDTTVSKGMVKYASNLTRESIIDVEGTISVPQEPIAACSQSEVLAFCNSANLDLANFHMPLPAGLWILPKKAFCQLWSDVAATGTSYYNKAGVTKANAFLTCIWLIGIWAP